MAGEAVTIRVARRVYVGNLAWQTSWQDLKDHFSQVGRVRYADVLREGGPGSRSKGCGLVEFETPEEAAAAITELHDSELHGRKMFVREDRDDYELREAGGGGPPPRRGGGGYADRGGGGYADRYGGPPDRYRSRSPARRPYSGGGGGREGVVVGRRVYVGNLAYETTWQELKDHMKQAGRVLHADILVDPSGRSKGSGTCEFERPEDALHAISTLSNTMLGGRQIHVREDREDPSVSAPPPARYGGGGGGGGAAAPGTQIVVHGLPYRMSWQDLKDLCKPAGAVIRADIATDRDGRSRGFGTVAFATPSDADAALEMLNSGMELDGRPVSAKRDRYA